jgi:hypothetical protein
MPAPRPTVIAFDLAGRTGVAFGRVGETPRAHTIDLDRLASQNERLAEMLRVTEVLLSRNRPDIVAYEAPVGGPKTSHFLVAVAGCFVGEATRLSHQPRSISISTVRKHFLGRALSTTDFPGLTKARAKEAIKAAVLTRCGQLGWAPRTHDEADAMAIWDYAGATYGRAQSAPLGGLFDRREGSGP